MSEEELIKAFMKHGFERETARHLARLFLYVCGKGTLEKWEVKRWQSLNILDEYGQLLVGSDEDSKSDLFWIMLGLTWEGLVKRSIEG